MIKLQFVPKSVNKRERGEIMNVVHFLEVHWNASFKVEKEKELQSVLKCVNRREIN